MLLHFRQGIVEAQIPVFFRVTYPSVDLIVTDTNTTVAFAAGSKDYLYTEQVSVANAWGPLHLGIDQWLYWDLDNRTGYRTFGITIVEPIVASTMPSSPLMDQHWFDTSTNEMKVWTGNVWSKKIRAFACKLAQGRVPVSMSANSPSFIGTQVGNTSDTYAGHILYDATTNNAIKNANGQFVTTEDKLSTKTISLSQVKVASIIVEGEAQQNMAAHTIVVFSEFGKIVHADQFVAEQPIQFGIIESSVVVGQTVNVVTSGMVTSQAFDFSALGVNALLYCSSTGQLVSVPVVPNQTPVAVVVDRKTIQLGVALASSTDTIPVINLATDTVYGISRLSVPAEDAEDPIVVSDNDPRFDSYVRKVGDMMLGPLYLSGSPTQDLHAATKKYVDDSRTPAAGSTMQVQYNLNGQFAASSSLSLTIPTETTTPMAMTVGSADHLSAVITTGSRNGNLQVEAGGRQDSQPGSAVLQGGSLSTTGDITPSVTTFTQAGHSYVIGGTGYGAYGIAGDAVVRGGTGDISNGRVIITGGTNYDIINEHSTAAGGSVQIAGGDAQGTTSTTNGGNVTISGGAAAGSGIPGSVQIFTDGISRVVYDPAGAWLLGDAQTPGSSGQVLTSSGPGAAPIWGDVSAGAGLADRIVDNNTIVRVYDTVQSGAKVTTSIDNKLIVNTTSTNTTFIDNSTPYWQTRINYNVPGIASWSNGPVIDSANNSYITVTDDNTGETNYLSKIDPSGNVLWSLYWNTAANFILDAVATDGINSYVSLTWGAYTSILHKVNNVGNIIWSTEIGDTANTGGRGNQAARSLAVSFDGTKLYVAGSSSTQSPVIYEVSMDTGALLSQHNIVLAAGYDAGVITQLTVDANSMLCVGETWDSTSVLPGRKFIADISANFVVNWMVHGTDQTTPGDMYLRYWSRVARVGQYAVAVGSITHDQNATLETVGCIAVIGSTGAIVHELDVTSSSSMMPGYDATLMSVAVDPSSPNVCVIHGDIVGVTASEVPVETAYYTSFNVATGSVPDQFKITYNTPFVAPFTGRSPTWRTTSAVVSPTYITASVIVRDRQDQYDPNTGAAVQSDQTCTYQIPKYTGITLGELVVTPSVMVQTNPTVVPVGVRLTTTTTTVAASTTDTSVVYQWSTPPTVMYLPATRTASATGYDVEIQGTIIPDQIKVAGSTGSFNSLIWHNDTGPVWTPDYMSMVYNLQTGTISWNNGLGLQAAVVMDPMNGFHQYDTRLYNMGWSRWLLFKKGLDPRKLWRIRVELMIGGTTNLWIANENGLTIDAAYGNVFWITGETTMSNATNGSDGSQPTLYEFYTRDGGNTWYGIRLRGYTIPGG